MNQGVSMVRKKVIKKPEIPKGNWGKKEVPAESLKGLNALAIQFFDYDDDIAELDGQKKEITQKQMDLSSKIEAILQEAGLPDFRCSKGLLYYRTFNTCKVTDWFALRKSIGEDAWASLAKPSTAAVSKWFNREKEKREEDGEYEYKLEGVVHNEFTKLVKKKK